MNLLKKRPLAAALFVFFAGSFLSANITFLFRAILFGVSLVAGIVLLIVKKRIPLAVFSAFLLAAAALLTVLSSDLPDYAIGARKGAVERYTFRAIEPTDEENNVWLVGSVTDAKGRLFCRLTADLPDETSIRPGDKLEGEGVVSGLSAFARRSFFGRGCRGKLTLTGEVETIGHTLSLRAPFLRLAETVRETLSSRVEGENGGLLVAVLLGETEELPTGTGLLFRRAGISHALAVSGMHLVFLSAALSFLLRKLGLPRPAVSAAVVLFAFSYAALVGFTPSVLRASLMLFFYEASWFARRQPDSLSSLALSGAVMLLCAPYLVYSVSFLLSYLATLGILLAAQFSRSRKRSRAGVSRAVRRIGTYALMTLFAVLFTLPVSAALFGELSLLSIPANLLLSIPIQLLLYLAVAVLVFPLPFVSVFAERYCALFLFLLRRIAALRPSPLSFSSPVLSFFGALPLLALLAVAFLGMSKRKRIVLCTVTGALTIAAFLILALPTKSEGQVVLLSNRKDDDLILLRYGRRAACIDLGSPDGNLSSLTKELKADRIFDVERYVFTCYDDNTTERFREVLSSVYVRRAVLTEPDERERAEYEALTALLDRIGIEHTTAGDGFTVFGYAIRTEKYASPDGVPTVPVVLSLSTDGDRLLYVGENVPIPFNGVAIPEDTTAVFLGSHGETRYLSFRQTLPASVKAVFFGSEFYETCAFTGGADEIEIVSGKRFVPKGFTP